MPQSSRWALLSWVGWWVPTGGRPWRVATAQEVGAGRPRIVSLCDKFNVPTINGDSPNAEGVCLMRIGLVRRSGSSGRRCSPRKSRALARAPLAGV